MADSICHHFGEHLCRYYIAQAHQGWVQHLLGRAQAGQPFRSPALLPPLDLGLDHRQGEHCLAAPLFAQQEQAAAVVVGDLPPQGQTQPEGL